MQGTQASNQVTTGYGWGADGLRTQYTPTGQGKYINPDSSFGYLYDLSGNVSQRLEFYVSDMNAQYVGARDYSVYDAFGLLEGHWDAVAVPEGTGTDLTSLGFGGQYGYYTDMETGLCLLGARYYDASVGRFLNRDPTGYAGGINLYGFCGNNPVNEQDPDGEAAEDRLDELRRGNLGGALSAAQYYFRKGFKLPSYKASIGFSVSIGPLRVGVHVSVSSGNCFVAGTPVQMADGSVKKIEDVREGDLVLSRNPDTGVTESKPVVSRSVKAAPQVLMLTLTDPTTRLTQTITCTPGHPFYVAGQGFVLAGSLGIGTSIVTRAGPCLSVSAIKYEPKSTSGVLVYNFKVEDDHTYFVGTVDGGAWVHNVSVPGIYKVVPGGEGDDLAQAVQANRVANKDFGPNNHAVFEYQETVDGQNVPKYEFFKSGVGGHAEKLGVAHFESRKMLSSVTRVYSEKHPCMDIPQLCQQRLMKVPQAKIYYRDPYGRYGY